MIEKKSCGVIPVINKNGKNHFLVIHQHNGLWAFPKGHQEEGESELETAIRELREETGVSDLDIIPDRNIIETYYAKDNGEDYRKTVVYFVGYVQADEVTPQAEEIQDYRWLPFEEAEAQLSFDNTRETLRKAREIANDGYG